MLKKVLSLFWGLSILVSTCVFPVCAYSDSASNSEDTIRVAIPTVISDTDEDANSSYVGYTVEYLREISQYTGWRYEIVKVPGFYEEGLQEALDMVRSGTADLVAPVRYMDDLADELYFSKSGFTTGMTILQIPNSVYTGASLGSEVRVACLYGSGMEETANQFFEQNGMEPTYLMCQSVSEQVETVCSGDADVMLNSDLEYIPGTTVVAEFAPTSLYFAGADQDLMASLDQAIIYIKQSNESFEQELYQKYISGRDAELTLEEKTFIEKADPFVVAVMEGHAPYQFVGAEQGTYCGIAVDVLNTISQTTGLQFEFVSVDSWDPLLQLVNEGSVQIVAEVPCDYEFAFDRGLTITRSYASSPYVLLCASSFPGPSGDQKLALVDVSAYAEQYYIGDVVRYSTMGSCIEAVRSGQADYTYVDLYTAQYFLGESRYSALEIVPQSYTPRSVCFGLAKPTSHELLSIINKSINQLSAVDVQNIITQNVSPYRDVTAADVIEKYPVQSFLMIAALGVFIASLLVLLLWRKERMAKILRKKAMEDSLTHLYNALACRKLVTEKLEKRKSDQIGAFLIMDMDNFKQINDQCGHQMGDFVLKEFADMIRRILHENSVIARIGGDEFVVYVESLTAEEKLPELCERILKSTHTILAGDKPVTISIGAVLSKKSDDYDTLYRLADKALYKAKYNQRDQFCIAECEE